MKILIVALLGLGFMGCASSSPRQPNQVTGNVGKLSAEHKVNQAVDTREADIQFKNGHPAFEVVKEILKKEHEDLKRVSSIQVMAIHFDLDGIKQMDIGFKLYLRKTKDYLTCEGQMTVAENQTLTEPYSRYKYTLKKDDYICEP